MKPIITVIPAACLLLAGTGCSTDDLQEHDFSNIVYIDAAAPTATMLIKEGVSDYEQTITASTAEPLAQEVTLRYEAAPELTDAYNAAYYDDAVALPETHYAMSAATAVIPAGSATSTEAAVRFMRIDELDRDTRYVLPVRLAEAPGVSLLESKRTIYYLFKGAALINVVGDIAQNYLSVKKWNNAAALNNLSTVTLEALIRVRDFGLCGGLKSIAMSTILGIENQFLLRIGDSGIENNQLQLVTPGGKFTASGDKGRLPTDEWVHIAAVYDTQKNFRALYINGELIEQDAAARTKINLGNSNFYVGRSFDDKRWLNGEISEVRIWNVARTEEQIAANIYKVDPESEGLAAYWKFNEGAGAEVKDRTNNANHLTAQKPIEWVEVALPAEGR